ncbi:polymer-forming cytoskeletal protein [Hahella sp. KA22]|uniref:bactofilin family protein n=1 Tax=Hahella sp. KA22 TaxID=1628392 RepID=UPI000FDE6F3C|nr:polymer-forming cytoskeletal protein [Hahella sp. KA22]AZZ94640.1 polymer-forming cytoskeletal protein [Hahella sp. KA22]QAY58013.1 polymer-forming cytoskeletal protein [Hahella sp. KA22]
MFGKKKTKSKNVNGGHFDTLISRSTEIKGDLQFTGGLHIDGKILGKIKADTTDEDAIVRVSDVGEVNGDVIAPHIIINGKVNGDVYSSEHIELAPKASITGNVYYNLIEMAMGAEVNGNLVHSKESVSTATVTATDKSGQKKAAKEDKKAGKTQDGTGDQPELINLASH